eukprot:1143362-Pelagomonas_calceolata.AAC.3
MILRNGKVLEALRLEAKQVEVAEPRKHGRSAHSREGHKGRGKDETELKQGCAMVTRAFGNVPLTKEAKHPLTLQVLTRSLSEGAQWSCMHP